MPKRKLRVRKQASARHDAITRETNADLDIFAHGPLQEIVDRFRSSLIEEAAKTAAGRPIDANDLERAYAVLCPATGSSEKDVWNRRRVYLIQKQLEGDILPEEVDELGHLQEIADRHMREFAPRPLEMLWDLKRELMGS